jgi:hypothetical protein
VTKLVSLSEDSPDYNWFATTGLFNWVADFLRARIEDPVVREKLRRDALSGYLFVGDLPEPAREQALRALREDLIPAVDTQLYPRPLDSRNNEPLFAARVKTLAVLAWDLARKHAAGDGIAAHTIVVSGEYEWSVRYGLYEWTVAFLRDSVSPPAVREHLTRALADGRQRLDLRALPGPGQAEALRLLHEEAVPAARQAAPAALAAAGRDTGSEGVRWAVGDVRVLALMAAATPCVGRGRAPSS